MRAIVDSATMKLLEERAFSSGQTASKLMDRVGEQLAAKVESLAKEMGSFPAIVLLSGKGNNGADGYTALTLLQKKNFPTVAWQIGEVSSKTLLAQRERLYIDSGGKVVYYPEVLQIPGPIIIIDGIYGLGFRGCPDEGASKAILWANSHTGPVVSIDIPSGVDPTTGEVAGEAIYADYTLACQFPKKGSFLGKGWEHSGQIEIAELPLKITRSDLYLMELSDAIPLLPRKRRTQNKYSAGSVVAVAGSPGMMGAASLACEAVLRVGAGYVRLLLSEEGGFGEIPREVVKTVPSSLEEWISFLQKADSVLVGPGLGRDRLDALDHLWPHIKAPAVIDADALYFLSKKEVSEWGVQGKILTPHLGELSRLIQKEVSAVDGPLLQQLRTLSSVAQTTIVLKGAPTFIFSEGKPTVVMPKGDPGMATAGSGDVLTGIIASFLAQGLSPIHSSMLATWLHSLAGEMAARKCTSYSLIASTLLYTIPQAMKALLDARMQGERRSYIPFGRAEALPENQ